MTAANRHDRDNCEYPPSDDPPAPSTLPEVYNYEGAEALNPPGHSEDKQVIAVHRPLAPDGYASLSSPDPASARPLWKRKRWIFATVALLVFVILAAVLIPVGLLVLKNDGDDSSTPNTTASGSASATATVTTTSGPTLSPTANPDDPILKGTRLETMGSRKGDVLLYYQSGDGGLHFISMDETRAWQGSRDLEVTDAKLGTPLASTSADVNGTIFWWLFYVDNTNRIRNIYSKGDPASWHKGSVDSKEYKVPDDPSIAFAARRGIKYDKEKGSVGGGINLYATDLDGVVREYIYDDKTEGWGDGASFDDADGYSGVTTWGVYSYAFFFARSKDSPRMKVWWRDYDPKNLTTWQPGPQSEASAMQGGGMWGGFAFAFQDPDGTIRGHKVDRNDYDPSDTSWGVAYDISEGDNPAVNGTGLSGFYFFPSDAGTRFHVFYQAEETGEIVEAVWDYPEDEDEDHNQTVPGPWRYNTVPIH